MNILILNWRDPLNPKAGGAEKLNMHILKPLIKEGNTVTWYARELQGLKSSEIYEGIHVIRFGNVLTHFLLLPFFLWTKKFGEVDIIIDCIHGTGYLSNLLAPRTKKIVLICEVAKDIWNEMYPFPVNALGLLWEKIMFRFYRRSPFWTISSSTKTDLIASGIPSQKIKIVPMGFDGITFKTLPPKYKEPTALFVGRLAKMKGIEDAILAVSKVSSWRLIIIGRGDRRYESELQKMVSDLGLKNRVDFMGYIPEREKFESMAKAWVLLVPSRREGWGMIVTEANSVGTKVIGYRVAGLVDSLSRVKENVAVDSHVQSLVKAMKKIDKATIIDKRPLSGWDELYRFVKREL